MLASLAACVGLAGILGLLLGIGSIASSAFLLGQVFDANHIVLPTLIIWLNYDGEVT